MTASLSKSQYEHSWIPRYFRKTETQDPLHKWIGTYNTFRMHLPTMIKDGQREVEEKGLQRSILRMRKNISSVQTQLVLSASCLMQLILPNLYGLDFHIRF